MPTKSRRNCGFPGCPALVSAGERYCPAHRSARRGGDTSHYDRRWRKLRERFLSKHPLCAHCEKVGRLIPATEVHHILPVAEGGSDREENLLGLCKPCHSRITIGAIHHR